MMARAALSLEEKARLNRQQQTQQLQQQMPGQQAQRLQ